MAVPYNDHTNIKPLWATPKAKTDSRNYVKFAATADNVKSFLISNRSGYIC